MQEAEICRIMIPSQPWQKKSLRLHFNGKKLSTMAYTCVVPANVRSIK
jgi:hypothetical protein